MSNPTTIKIVYAVLVNRFSNVSNDLSTFVLTYDSQEQAEAYVQKQLNDTQYSSLRFACTIVPMTIISPDARFLHFSVPAVYIDAKLASNLSAIKPIFNEDQKQAE